MHGMAHVIKYSIPGREKQWSNGVCHYGRERMKTEEKERKSLYYGGWILLALGMLYLILSKRWDASMQWALPCLFHTLTGAYCPGCGGTRAVHLLLEGEVLLSLYYHPLVLYGALLYVWFMVSNTVEYISKGRYRIGMRYRRSYVAVGIAVLILNFIIKNGALVLFGWHMLE